jgi:hypothetical protein
VAGYSSVTRSVLIPALSPLLRAHPTRRGRVRRPRPRNRARRDRVAETGR